VKQLGIFVILATGAAAGWFAPDLVADKPEVQAAAVPGAAGDDRQLGALRAESWNAGEVSLPRAGDGHFYADVTIDGTSAQMLVDTGASMVALTAEDAEAMGVQWNQDEVRMVARGANGPVYGVPVMLGQVQLGQLEAQNVEAVVIPQGLGISLLGQSFLSKIDHVEMVDDQMVLGG